MWWVVAWSMLVAGCAASGDRVGGDAGRADAGDVDAGTDGGTFRDAELFRDAGDDAGVSDAGDSDSGGVDGGGTDAGGMDAGRPDAGPPDAGTPRLDAGPGTLVRYECVPPVAGNEMNSGISLDTNFWSGFRFEVTGGAAVTTTAIGLNIRSGTPGTIFGALVRLTGRTDQPDRADLTGPDVLGTTLVSVPGGPSSTTVSGPISVVLTPGWYAVVFGTGAFGATLGSGSVHSNSGNGGCGSGYGFPFTLRQSDGRFILQAATPHFAVEAVRP